MCTNRMFVNGSNNSLDDVVILKKIFDLVREMCTIIIANVCLHVEIK